MSQLSEIHPDRLCAAADACLEAFRQAVGYGWSMLPVQLWDTYVGDRCYRGFLKDEIVQAQAFLIRLGAIPRRVA